MNPDQQNASKNLLEKVSHWIGDLMQEDGRCASDGLKMSSLYVLINRPEGDFTTINHKLRNTKA